MTFRAQCATRRAANCSTMAGQKARRSSGERLVVNWPSTTTSVSTTSAPALRRSVHRLGHEVSVTPRTRPASSSVHGPWQIAAMGLPVPANTLTKPTASAFIRSWSGLTVPPGGSSSARMRRRWTQERLAMESGFSLATVRAVEQGRRSLDNMGQLLTFARALEIPVTDLTGQPYAPASPEQDAGQGAVAGIRRELLLAEREPKVSDAEAAAVSIPQLRSRVERWPAVTGRPPWPAWAMTCRACCTTCESPGTSSRPQHRCGATQPVALYQRAT